MYAVIVSGGKQYRVEEGQVVRLEKIELPIGESLDISEVLMVSNGESVNIGAPYVEGSKVSAEIVAHGRGKKVRIIKFRRRKHSRSSMGHRQDYTELKITKIAS